MRTVIHALAIIAAVLAAQTALGQASPAAVPVKTEEPAKPDPLGVARARIRELEERLADKAKLDRQRFDLDFPGGGPEALVAAIEKATGRTLNAIVPSEERNVQLPPMKLTNVRVEELFLALKLASTNRVYGFNSITESSYGFENRGVGENPIWTFHSRRPPAEPTPQKFDLNFPGGGPRALVAAIEKATGKRLNAIVQGQEGAVYIPPMKLTNVTVRDVFGALTLASGEKDFPGNNYTPPHYCFQTTGQGEDAVWCFHVDLPRFSNVCRYFQLAEYLDNFTIEDITTAIQTGWKLLGVQPTSNLKFHPETKLLIAVGQSQELQTIEDVLSQLQRALPNPGMRAARPSRMARPIPAPTPKKDGGSNN